MSQIAAEQGTTLNVEVSSQDRIYANKTELLFDNVTLALLVSLFMASLLAYALWDLVPRAFLLAWIAAHIAVNAVRAAILFAYRCYAKSTRMARFWRWMFDLGSLLSGLVWGSVILITVYDGNLAIQMFLWFVLGGMSAGAVGTLAISMRSYLLFLIPTLVPFILQFFLMGKDVYVSMGLMVAVFFAALLTIGLRYRNSMHDTFELRHRNLDLVEELKRTVRAAEEANESKSLFLANMSHEIRTPMNGVFGMTDLLRRTALSQKQLRLVETINHSAKTLLKIINDILDLSRIEAGKLEVDDAAFNLRRCVEGASELFIEEAGRKNVDLSIFVANDVPAWTRGDAGRLRQVLINLIGNAVKFTERGEIAVAARTSNVETDGSYIVAIDVRDTGIGIQPDLLERIEAPFEQADPSINRRFGGTGLGLSIAKHLVTLMGGELLIDTKVDKGTKVTVLLPLQETDVPEEDQHSVSTANLPKDTTILVVDDRSTNREIMRNYLEDSGANVLTATDAGSALHVLAEQANLARTVDAAVVDLLMPDCDGLELSRQIKNDSRYAGLPIVMVTSLNWHGDIAAARSAGIAELLSKPIRRDELISAVDRSLAGKNDSEPTRRFDGVLQPRKCFSGHVLIAEDNPVNQEVIREYIETFGCSVTLTENGQEAVRAFQNEAFDLILMDCHMPEMDGFAATQSIRETERRTGRKRTPVVAVTANAFEGCRQQCEAMGMDGFIAKPFHEAQIATEIGRWLPSVACPLDHERPALDGDTITRLKTERPQLLNRMVKVYLKHAPETLAAMQDGVEAGNIEKVQRAAHSLKSSSANVGALELSTYCREIEHQAETIAPARLKEQVETALAAYDAVEMELWTLTETLSAGETEKPLEDARAASKPAKPGREQALTFRPKVHP